jgi:hypothetical protein
MIINTAIDAIKTLKSHALQRAFDPLLPKSITKTGSISERG